MFLFKTLKGDGKIFAKITLMEIYGYEDIKYPLWRSDHN